jgi:MFS family permease
MYYEQTKAINLAKNRAISPWLVWALGAAFFFSEYFARVSPSVMAPDLMADFHSSAFQLGSLSAFFYYAYVGMQIPVGMLVDRYGAHRLLTIMAALCAGACLMFSMAHDLAMAELARFLMGFAASFAFVGSLKLASVWFPATRFGLLAGLTQALGMLGATVGEAPLAYTVSAFGWRHTMAIIAVIFLGLSVLIGVIVRDRPTGYRSQSPEITSEKVSIFKGLLQVLANPQSWHNAFYVGLLYAPSAAFAELWGPSFLHTAYGMSLGAAATANGLIFIGWGVGGPIVGWLSDKIQARKPIMIASVILCLIIMSAILYVPNLPLSVLFSLLFLYGVCNTGVAISYAVAAEINPHKLAGTSVAFSNMASVIVGAAFQPIIGKLIDMHWNGLREAGVPVYNLSDYHYALIILPICLILGVLFVFLIKETHCKNQEQSAGLDAGRHRQ